MTTEKIIYFSDRMRAQYKKQKNLLNITWCSENLGLPAEWRLHATSHGKSACDGIAGTQKVLQQGNND
jgi:hypothetical protein